MRCTSPRTVGFKSDGKTLCWSSKSFSKEYQAFQLPCGKCIECRLEYARQWAVRCVHEASMYDDNIFLTLTYSDDHNSNPKLNYLDFQLFIKRLRDKIFRDFLSEYGSNNWKLLTKEEKNVVSEKFRISVFVTGEYGEKNKRKHWHACIFNYKPKDALRKYTTDRGDQVYSSEILSELWPFGFSEFGSVTFESAGYCARYAAKKLIHGPDQTNEFKPISKKSSKKAIGKKWLEKFWPDVFNYGKIILPDGKSCGIPRYYEKWLKENQRDAWEKYIMVTKQKICDKSAARSELELLEYKNECIKRGHKKGHSIKRSEVRRKIIEQKFKMLQDNLKL